MVCTVIQHHNQQFAEKIHAHAPKVAENQINFILPLIRILSAVFITICYKFSSKCYAASEAKVDLLNEQ
jgi:hypothetical protein